MLDQHEVQGIVWDAKKSTMLQLANIKAFIKSFNRYAKSPIILEPEEALTNFNKRLASAESADYRYDFEMANEIQGINNAARNIMRAKMQKTIFYQWEAYSAYTIFLSILGLALLVFLRIGLRDFLISIVSGGVLIFASTLLLIFTRTYREGTIAILFFLEWFGAIAMISILKQTVFQQLMKRILWSLVILTSPFIPIGFFIISNQHLDTTEAFASVAVGCIMTFLAWLALFNQQLLKVHSEPKIN